MSQINLKCITHFVSTRDDNCTPKENILLLVYWNNETLRNVMSGGVNCFAKDDFRLILSMKEKSNFHFKFF